MQMNNDSMNNYQEKKLGVDPDTLWVQPHKDVAKVKTGELEDALEKVPEEIYNYFSQMKDEYLWKIMWKDEGYNEVKDHLSYKYAMSKTIRQYWHDVIMKYRYFKDIQKSIDEYDDYLSERWEEIESF